MNRLLPIYLVEGKAAEASKGADKKAARRK